MYILPTSNLMHITLLICRPLLRCSRQRLLQDVTFGNACAVQGLSSLSACRLLEICMPNADLRLCTTQTQMMEANQREVMTPLSEFVYFRNAIISFYVWCQTMHTLSFVIVANGILEQISQKGISTAKLYVLQLMHCLSQGCCSGC